MKNQGWIKIHRSITSWEWYENIDTRLVFLHLLLTVNHQPTSWQGIVIPSGSRVFGREKLAKEIGISIQTLRRTLANLQNSQQITIKSTNKYSLLSITNWHKYQLKKPADQPTNNQQTNQQPTTSKEYIRSKEILSKDNTYGDPQINFILDTYFKKFNFNPTDKINPRFYAHIMRVNINRFIKDCSPYKKFEFNDVVEKSFAWYMKREGPKGETLDVVRRKFKILFGLTLNKLKGGDKNDLKV